MLLAKENIGNLTEVIIHCLYAENKISVKKIMILNKHLLIFFLTYMYECLFDEGDYILLGLSLGFVNITSFIMYCRQNM